MVAQVDRTRIEQLLANLLDNAIKYTPGRGRITIELDRDPQQPEGWLRLAVSDTGAGMPPDRLEDAFAMFVQYDQTLEHSQGGLGLGLSLVKRLAELHGGSISAQSDGLGRGTTMVLRLPRALPAAVAMATEAARAPRDDHAEDQSQRILLVEDNEDFRQLMAFRLRRAGFDVSQAANGIAGKRKALEDQPDAILIDLGLPEIDGYELARDVRAAQSPVAECTLIAMSGYGSQTARDATREAGFDAHLVKPVDFDRLIALLRD
jgi:CheY-like chemotaxis protein/anti-sigma regulatory factor (Ser/Thr protein kinase)